MDADPTLDEVHAARLEILENKGQGSAYEVEPFVGVIDTCMLINMVFHSCPDEAIGKEVVKIVTNALNEAAEHKALKKKVDA